MWRHPWHCCKLIMMLLARQLNSSFRPQRSGEPESRKQNPCGRSPRCPFWMPPFQPPGYIRAAVGFWPSFLPVFPGPPGAPIRSGANGQVRPVAGVPVPILVPAFLFRFVGSFHERNNRKCHKIFTPGLGVKSTIFSCAVCEIYSDHQTGWPCYNLYYVLDKLHIYANL